jgi:2-polyprenyl-3-methyl-5-hydroxy-6-metoxy-1,4-benzoquinol methylase
MVPMFGTICADSAAALGAIDLRADPQILDIGTGSGNFAIFLAMQGFRVLTGEPHTDEFRYARQQWDPSAAKMGVRDRIRFENFDAGALPFDKTRFDAVFLFGVLHHVEEGA